MSDFLIIEEESGTEVLEIPAQPDYEVVEVAGAQGPQGPKGDRGEPGTASPGSFYVHDQAQPEAIWVVNHGMGMYPNATVVDSGGTQVEGSVTYVSGDTIEIEFAAPFAGKVFLS